MKKRKGYYSISAVSEMVGIHPQTIRMYEREGFFLPKRSDGNTRMFSEEDVELLESIIYYTNKLGVNLAGVEIILKMQKKIEKLQSKINEMFTSSKEELEKDKIEFSSQIKYINEEMKKIKDKTRDRVKKSDTL